MAKMADAPVPRILVMDTGPLITLAVAESLDYLLYPAVPVIIPDAVLFEATRKGEALGAASITEWVQVHADRVNIVPTTLFEAYVGSLEFGLAKVPDLGERSALEVIGHTPFVGEHEVAILLTEDDQMIRGLTIPENERHRIIVVTTHDFLEGLERAQLINSVEAVYARADDGGRMASKRQSEKAAHDRAMAAVEAAMKTNGPKA
jgi:hypothetical protein